MSLKVSRRNILKTIMCGSIAAPFVALAQADRMRDLVARVQDDLQRAADFTRNNEKERDRYHNVQHHLSEFDRELRVGKFDKGKLDDVIDDLKSVVKNNTLEARDRDALAADLSDLRTMRDMR